MLKSRYFCRLKILKKYCKTPFAKSCATPLQPPVNLAEFGTPAIGMHTFYFKL